ncbi:uncharacterized protein PHALS_13920 [Plasmopara halstedii]|uniref:Transmembrane protein n=1 Tax=Plasmopara halstedii TaxID=4781 RepID=A0A0P1A4R8_PLAHL|nr:uncharacterized protein PHALS_13920 [Plasmopara halstedii]CEG35168.1 hypothetical protein PHALS_13920 [Plasmopara halstedii]|eukprot:XP_024571537.1 hypothetical protein PHALS_13920 [Plasmopara halstedii]
MSIGSLQFSFSEDTEHFFAESFDDVAKMATDLDTSASVGLQQQRDLKRDNLPIAIITSAVDSFTQEGNLDDIIKDIKRTSSSHSLIKRNTEEMRTGRGSFGSYVVTGSSSSNIAMGNTNSTAQIQVEPSGTNSLDFDMNELDELTNYFLWDNDVAMFDHRETQTKSTIMNQRVAMAGQNSQLTKMHSLDFDAEVSICESSTRSKIVVGEVKFEDTVPISSFVANPVTAMSFSCPHYPTVIDIQTKFLDKYWRNDRKNIQCFPRCPEHGDYYRVRIENLQHRCKGVCRAPVRAHVCIPAPVSASVTQHGLLVLARCNSTFSRNSNSTEQQLLSLPEIKALRAVSAVGTVDNFTLDTEGVNFDVIFHPDVWKFEFDLPKKRRYVQNSNSNVPLYGADRDIDGDLASAEFLYFFEIDVFYSSDQTHFERLGHMKSKSFQIGNTRTLLRRRNKLVGENHIIGGSYATDSDQLADVDELPEKKRIKVAKSRHEIVSGKSFSEDGFGSSGLTGSRVSTANNAGEDIFSSPKRDFPDEKSTILNVDRLSKFDFQDVVNWKKDLSEFSQVKVNFWEDGNIEDAVASNYFPFISPKQNSGNVLAIYSPVFAALPMKAQSNDQPVTSGSRVMEKAPSLAKFMVYSLVCVPLSMLLLPVGLILLIGFLIFPPAASKIVSTLDAMSDLELSRANISCTSEDHRMVLNRLIEHKDEHAGNLMTVMFRYHTKGKVWGRIFYFSGAKFVFSIISIIPAFFLTSMAGLLYPIRPVSSALAKSACGFALWSREYTRETMGKPLARVDEVDAVV